LKIPSSKDRAAGPASKRAGGLWPCVIPVALGGIAAIALLTALMLWKLLPDAAGALEAQSRETHGRTYAAVFDGRIMELRRWLGAAAAAPSVRAALQSGDATALREAGALLDSVLEFAPQVEVFPPGATRRDEDPTAPLSHAARDAIRRAEAGAFVGPEAALDGDRKEIYAAQPVEVDGRVIGVVFATIDAGYFLAPLANFDTTNGELSLEQAFDQTHALPVLAWGEGDPAAAPQRLALAAPHWTLIYRPARHPLPPALDTAPVVTAALVALGLFLLGLVVAYVRFARGLQQDTARLETALLANAPDVTAPDTVTDLDGAAQTAASVAPDASIASAAAPTPTDTSPGPEEFLEIESPRVEPQASAVAAGSINGVEAEIFRACDIHGITDRNLTEDVVYRIGRAFAAEALERGARRIAVGRDGRHSSLPLRNALVKGLCEGGVDVADIGEVPTPLLYFATHVLETGSGIMITGSHHPPEYNGLELMLGGEAATPALIQTLRDRIEQDRLSEGAGQVERVDLHETYVDRIVADVVVAQPLKIVVDCGNGVAGRIAPELISRLDCEVIPLYCDVDGDFPNHPPNPAEPRNLEDLITVVKAEGADLGLAFDGDGDRLGVVTGSGRVIWPDRLLMLFAEDIVGRNPGADIVYDVKCSRHLNTIISELGGRPIMWKTGHSNIKAKLRETGALLGGEFSGHICFGERWYGFDDALYAAARLLEILGAAQESADALFARFPRTTSTPEIRIPISESTKLTTIERLTEEADFGAGTLTTIDGIRVDYEDGWGLVRPSNTGPALTLRFEADTEEALKRIQAIFAAQLNRLAPELNFR
jgi:phosphomannomutase / phosphoglucomutase